MKRVSFTPPAVRVALLVLLASSGCDGSDPQAGGNSGAEGEISQCDETATSLELDSPGETVGFSARELLELANRAPEVGVRWTPRDSGPDLAASAETLMIAVEPRGEQATELVCTDPDYPDRYRPLPHLELPVTLTLRTADGLLDETLEGVLTATEPEHAAIPTITLEPEALTGTLGQAVAEFYSGGYRSVMFELTFDEHGAQGWIGGPFSPHRSSPCAYTAYASWPADAVCWPEQTGKPIDDVTAMESHLARVNRSFELSWKDGETTEVELEVKLAGGATCGEDDAVSHRVQIHMTSADGRIDLTLPGMLSGGPSTIDPWPASLRHITPFDLSLSGSIALDAAGLADQLGYANEDIATAISSFYLASPSGIDDPELSGALRVVAIDRGGFATPLPEVELPGGDSERCFSAGSGNNVLLAGNIALR